MEEKNTPDIRMIPVVQIAPEKNLNCRKKKKDPDWEDFVASVKAEGVLQSLLVRPAAKSDPNGVIRYRIVAGHRRWQAAVEAKIETVPAMVKELDAAAARKIMLLENLQRRDLERLEAAEGYRDYMAQEGADLAELAAAVGRSESLIRRYIAVLKLSKKLLQAWHENKVPFKSLELLLRISDPGRRKAFLDEHLKDLLSHYCVLRDPQHLARAIDALAIPLSAGSFDKKECSGCPHNSETQGALFAVDIPAEALCQKPVCFETKQVAWLQKNFATLKPKERLHTKRFVLANTLPENISDAGFREPPMNVKTGRRGCPNCTAVLVDRGTHAEKVLCGSDKGCRFAALQQQEIAEEARLAAEKAPDPVTVEKRREELRKTKSKNRATKFREEFLERRMPGRIKETAPESELTDRMALIALATETGSDNTRLAAALGEPADPGMDHWISPATLTRIVQTAPIEKVRTALRDIAAKVFTDNRRVDADGRARIAVMIGIDFAREWEITPKYLAKLTTVEMRILLRENGLMTREVERYMYDVMGVNAARGLEGMSKPQLLTLFEKAVNLKGVVPREILKIPETDPSGYLETPAGAPETETQKAEAPADAS